MNKFTSWNDRDKFDTRHGGPFDRGSADSYYRRGRQPHYYTGGTGMSDRIEQADMTEQQIADYQAGFDWNEQFGDTKDWE